MRIVVAIGGSALLKRGEEPALAAQRADVHTIAAALAEIARDNELFLICSDGRAIERELRGAMADGATITFLSQTIIDGAGGNEKPKTADMTVDKDFTAAALAEAIGADRLVFLTNVDGVYLYWKTFAPEFVARARAGEIDKRNFAERSMAPKVEAACRFARNTKRSAFIGNISQVRRVIDGLGGTRIDP